MRSLLSAALVCAAVAIAGCGREPRPALHLDGNRLTIYNDTDEEWRDVEVILNHHFHITPEDIPKGGIVQAPLDIFVAGYGQRFNFKTMQITDLRLKAKRANGEPLERQYDFRKDGLEGALDGFKGKK